MSIDFKLPAVGENVNTAEIGPLKVAVGDVISANQVVMEIETDKAVFELPCPHAGKVAKIHVKPGDSVQTGALLLTIEGDGAAATEETPKEETPSPTQQEPAAAKPQAP